jgi:chorismate mutase
MIVDINITEQAKWKIPVRDRFIIAGPCSVESEEQIRQTALGCAEHGANLLRGGIWKPRTRPGTFQGIGVEGLKWLKQAGFEANLPVTVEVATPNHIEHCLKQEIDVLWIGARTTTNPYLVQEIANSLKGVDIEIMVKNPMNPELELWIGALERLNKAGLGKLIAVHRGFSVYKSNLYRNQPYWEIPQDLKRVIPDIPLICDPSHICGNTELLLPIAQKAMDLQYDGLMIEIHFNPKNALSDVTQQIRPEELGNLLKKLKTKTQVQNTVHH